MQHKGGGTLCARTLAAVPRNEEGQRRDAAGLLLLVALTRFELAISALRGRRPKPLDDRAVLAGVAGVEPTHTEPESAVLPLYDTPTHAQVVSRSASAHISRMSPDSSRANVKLAQHNGARHQCVLSQHNPHNPARWCQALMCAIGARRLRAVLRLSHACTRESWQAGHAWALVGHLHLRVLIMFRLTLESACAGG